jgi:large subunit ribosomal protein L21
MFAIIETLGRQYKVSVGDKIKVDRIADAKRDDAAIGTKVTFSNVLLVSENDGASCKIGLPLLKGATVVGKIMEQGKDKKVIAFKKKRRQGYTRKLGFRRQFTVIQIENILAA